MSYKFNLDHTLLIADIHDMITIDIKPETRCTVTGGDIEIHGYLNFRGSYLTPELGEAPFEGQIPLDITLPYLGGTPDVRPEVVAFDYRVAGNDSLTLNLELALSGYQEETPQEEVMDAWLNPVVEEPTYEEAVIEPFDFATTVSNEESATRDEDFQPFFKEVATEEIPEEVVVVELDESIEVEEEKEPIPYSPLVDVEERAIEVEEIQFEKQEETPVEVSETAEIEAPVIEEIVPVADEVEVRTAPKLTASAAALMDELFAMKRGTAFKKQAELRDEVVTEVEVPSAVVEPEEVTVSEVEVLETEVDRVEVEEIVLIKENSVAQQFADGETTIKMVYVGHESETLGGVLERYSATLDDVWNLSELEGGVSVGDCVMLRYEKSV